MKSHKHVQIRIVVMFFLVTAFCYRSAISVSIHWLITSGQMPSVVQSSPTNFDYDRGYYWNNIQLGVDEIQAADIGRGDLITFKSWLPRQNRYNTKADHIAIVEDASYNDEIGWFDYCCIVNARGWPNNRPNIEYGRVRYEDLVIDFDVHDNIYKYLRFR
jgi:hypothetical protein